MKFRNKEHDQGGNPTEGEHSPNDRQHAKVKVPTLGDDGAAAPSPSNAWQRLIADGVEDQHGRRWVKIGDTKRGRWFRLASMVASDREFFRDLADVGYPILVSRDQRSLLQAVQDHCGYRKGLVADRPGWLAAFDGTRLYVYGDGTIIRPPGAQPIEVIVAFQPLRKFDLCGDLAGWQSALNPIVAEQTLPLFMLYIGLAPMLRDLTPADVDNLLLELEGDSGEGKSTLARLAASEWAGDPGRETLGAESWLSTLEALEDTMAAHTDTLLVLDEANKAGADDASQRTLIKKAIFRLSGTEGKARHGTGVEVTGARLFTISTSNELVTQLVRAPPTVIAAVRARMITLKVSNDGPLPALDRVPSGYRNKRAAMEALLEAIARHYGAAARAMIACLVRERAADEPQLRRRIARLIAKFNRVTGADALTGSAARASKLFAMAYAAGRLAREWGILPKSWGRASVVVRRVYTVWLSSTGNAPSAAQQLWTVLKQSQPHWRDAATVSKPLPLRAFRAAAGFVVEDGKQRILLVPASVLQDALPRSAKVLREMRDAGVVEGEEGRQRKLTVKAPRSLSNDRERVYRIRLDMLEKLVQRNH